MQRLTATSQVKIPSRITLGHDGVFIIESLRENHTGRRLFEQIDPICRSRGLRCEFHQVASPANFCAAIQAATATEWNPILHIEAHGLKNGIATANGELLEWKDLYTDVQQLNIACRNPPVSGKLPPDVIRRNGRITVFHRNGAEREHHG